MGWHARMHGQRKGLGAYQGDWGEVLDCVIAGLDHGARIDRVRTGGAEQQRVAVGRGSGCFHTAQYAGGARLVVDHDRLLEQGAEPCREFASEHVSGARRRKRHDQPHRAIGDRPCAQSDGASQAPVAATPIVTSCRLSIANPLIE